METDIEVQGIVFRVKYDWDDDAKTNLRIVSILPIEQKDLYDVLSWHTIDDIDSKLQALFNK